MGFFSSFPLSLQQAGAIFLSIIIEALPFVLIGALISGFIEVYIDPDKVTKWLPKQKTLAILFGCIIGFFFPSCECGIVPIINRFLEKNFPSYTAIPFLVTAPIMNPLVLFATYSAFGNSWKMALFRALGSFLLGILLGILLGFVWPESIQKDDSDLGHQHANHHRKGGQKVFQALVEAVDEFFDMGRYLVLGSLFAALVQVYIPTRILTSITSNPLASIGLLMLLSFLLSLCSEADAFIASSLISSFGFAPVLAFLVIGPVLDVKNLLMMRASFTSSFILRFMLVTISTVFVYSYLMGVLL